MGKVISLLPTFHRGTGTGKRRLIEAGKQMDKEATQKRDDLFGLGIRVGQGLLHITIGSNRLPPALGGS